jgi:hypothetical protein
MKRILLVVCLLTLYCNSARAQEKQSVNPSQSRAGTPSASRENGALAVGKLPVRRVVLYKNGVGYFEHLGHVLGSQDVYVDFTSAQLNDVLKSLTVLDLSGGRITGVDYNSEAPLARRLATLRLALGEKPTTAEFLGALRGARLEVRNGNGPSLTGKLLSVERKTQNGGNWTVETDEISLITDSGEVRSVDLSPTTNVRIAEKDLQTEGWKISRTYCRVARPRLAANDNFDCGNRRAKFICELHQRSAHLENDLPHRAPIETGEKTVSARLGDCRQHGR